MLETYLLPGTPRFNSMKKRIINTDWSYYDFHHPVFQSQNMSAQDLKDGHDWVTSRFYSLGRIIRRAWRYILRPRGLRTLMFFLSVNLAYYGQIRTWKIKGRNPEKPIGKIPKQMDNFGPDRLHGFSFNVLK